MLALMSKDLTHMTRIECHKLRAKWTHILGVLRLTGAQSTQLVELRRSHLASLRALYEDRQRLNMQARPCCKRAGCSGRGGSGLQRVVAKRICARCGACVCMCRHMFSVEVYHN